MILVTSAYGNQGKRLVPKLLAAGHRVRACVRGEASADKLRALGVQEIVVGDLADSAVIARAVNGVASVDHIGPTVHPAERAMIDAARTARVGHFVFSSVLHAISTDLIQHEIKRDQEEHLLSSGLEFTILQPSNYMLPHSVWPVFAGEPFRLTWALDRRQSMVDLDDITDVAALVLGDPERHVAATYELVGPGRFTAHAIAGVLSEVLGREVGAEQLETEAFVRARFGDGDPAVLNYQLKVIGAVTAHYSRHDFLGNSNVLAWLLGRPPTTFEGFVRREYAAFQLAHRGGAAGER